MSGLVDQYGNPLTIEQKFVRSAEENTSTMVYQQIHVDDIDKLISSYDWEILQSASRKLFANMGLVRGATLQKAAFTVGRGWDPVFKGQDRKWSNKVAK